MVTPFRSRPRSARPMPKGVEEILKVFIDNPKKAFANDDEIVAAVQIRKPSLSREEIVIRRKWLFEKRYIKHHETGGPRKKRYVLNPDRPEWPPAKPIPAGPAHRKSRLACGKPTLAQWRELSGAIPRTVSRMAAAIHDGTDSDSLREALRKHGLTSLAEHFAVVHTDFGTECWALRGLTGKSLAVEQEILTADAAKWLGLTQAQFGLAARQLGVKPSRHEFPNRGPIRRTYLWRAADVAWMYNTPQVAALRGRHDG